jgi:hypothetical protein
VIVHRRKGLFVVSEHKDKSGKRKNLGGLYSPAQAKARLRQVEYFKHLHGGGGG